MSTLQDALDGTDYWVALPSQEDTALHHPQSPGSSGGLLRGSLAITTTGLPPVSHQDLSRRTKPWLDAQLRDLLPCKDLHFLLQPPLQPIFLSLKLIVRLQIEPETL